METFKIGQLVKVRKMGKKAHPIVSKKIETIDGNKITFTGSEAVYTLAKYGEETMFSGTTDYKLIK